MEHFKENFLSYQPYRQMSISQIFDHGFEYLKKYTFRLEFSLQDYCYREIRFTYRTFKRSIWMVINAWLAIFYFTIMIFYPNNSYIINRIDFEQMLKAERMDILSIQLIIAFSILEFLWAKMLHKILQYRLSSIDFL
ncbi:uncharacterized protein LOC142597705 [Dermatophagoides farinae]|uniref:uncharacterized protein LOC142597705 n=1 Tax=Dermatophagoides farinae TaxID=6954 RepID=UPI003F637DE3